MHTTSWPCRRDYAGNAVPPTTYSETALCELDHNPPEDVFGDLQPNHPVNNSTAPRPVSSRSTRSSPHPVSRQTTLNHTPPPDPSLAPTTLSLPHLPQPNIDQQITIVHLSIAFSESIRMASTSAHNAPNHKQMRQPRKSPPLHLSLPRGWSTLVMWQPIWPTSISIMSKRKCPITCP
jgi:hypothetical protein